MTMTLLLEAAAWAREATVLILDSRAFAADERRLVESLRIYTRDIGSRLIIAGEAPTVIENDTLVALSRQAQSEGADVVAWTSRRSDGIVVYYVLGVRDLDLRETNIADLGGERAAETVALKVRTILTRPSTGAPREPGMAGAARPAAAPPPAPDAKAFPSTGVSASPPTAGLAPRAPAGTAVPGAPMVAAALRERPPWWRASFGAAYSAVFPVDGVWYRQGLTLTAEARLGRRPLYAYVDGTLTDRVTLAGDDFSVELGDLPFGAGLLWRWRMDRVSLAAGPRAALHVLDAHSTLSDGSGGRARQLSGAAGGLAMIEISWQRRLRLYGSVSGEALLPAREFTVQGASAIHSGVVQVGISLGAALLLP
jgi:hypothetical protein